MCYIYALKIHFKLWNDNRNLIKEFNKLLNFNKIKYLIFTNDNHARIVIRVIYLSSSIKISVCEYN